MVSRFNEGFEEHGIKVEHHMPDGDGVYMKRVDIPSGKVLHNHVHTFTHKSILAKGTALVAVDGQASEVTGPAVLTIEKGVQHSVEALTDITWFCIHASDEQDEEKIDHTLVGEN